MRRSQDALATLAKEKPAAAPEKRSHKRKSSAPAGLPARALNDEATMVSELWSAVRYAAATDGRPLASLFAALPSRADYPDYYQMIKKPIALDALQKRIEKDGKRYRVDDLVHDLGRMFTNAREYNQEGSQLCLDVGVLESIVTTFVQTQTHLVAAAAVDPEAAVKKALKALESQRPHAPKAFAVARCRWGLDKVAAIKTECPNLDKSQLASLAEAAWEKLSPSEQTAAKAEDDARLAAEVGRHEVAMAAYQAKRVAIDPTIPHQAAVAALRAKRPVKPKQGQTAFFLYCGDLRREVMDQTGLSVCEVSKELAGRWKLIAPEAKAAYQATANAAREGVRAVMEVYKTALAAWEAEMKELDPPPVKVQPARKAASNVKDYYEGDDAANGGEELPAPPLKKSKRKKDGENPAETAVLSRAFLTSSVSSTAVYT